MLVPVLIQFTCIAYICWFVNIPITKRVLFKFESVQILNCYASQKYCILIGWLDATFFQGLSSLYCISMPNSEARTCLKFNLLPKIVFSHAITNECLSLNLSWRPRQMCCNNKIKLEWYRLSGQEVYFSCERWQVQSLYGGTSKPTLQLPFCQFFEKNINPKNTRFFFCCFWGLTCIASWVWAEWTNFKHLFQFSDANKNKKKCLFCLSAELSILIGHYETTGLQYLTWLSPM